MNIFEHITCPKKKAFLLAYGKLANVSAAAEKADVARGCHYYWLKNDSEYREAFAASRNWVADRIADSLIDRLINGWTEEVYWQGKVVGEKRRFDHTAAISMMERLSPKAYGKPLPQVDQSVAAGPLVVEFVNDYFDKPRASAG